MTSQKNYRIHSFVSDLAIKAPCQAVSIANLTLAGAQTVNGGAVIAGDRVLVNAQTDASENGIYDVEATAWTRAADWNGERDATNGTIVIVAGDPLISLYQLDVTGTFTIGTSNATFVLMSTLDLAGTLSSTANGAGASQIGVEDAAGNYVGTDLETILAELSDGETGTFVTNWTGFSTAKATTWNYHRSGKIVVLHADGGVVGTSTGTGWTSGAGEVPVSLRPTETTVKTVIGVQDNGVFGPGLLSVSNSGQMSLLADLAQNGFTPSGQRQFTGGYVFTYMLD